MTTTRTIAGHALTLRRGRRYLAGRPMADGREWFPVAIQDITDGVRIDARPAAIVGPLRYDDANQLLRAFNSGPTSFHGRTWE